MAMFSARLPDELIEKLEFHAKEEKTSRSEMARRALDIGLSLLAGPANGARSLTPMKSAELTGFEKRLQSIEQELRNLPHAVRDELLEVLELDEAETADGVATEGTIAEPVNLTGRASPAEATASSAFNDQTDQRSGSDHSPTSTREPKASLYLDAQGELRQDRRRRETMPSPSMESRQGVLLKRLLVFKRETEGWTQHKLASELGLDSEQFKNALSGRADIINTPRLQARLSRMRIDLERSENKDDNAD